MRGKMPKYYPFPMQGSRLGVGYTTTSTLCTLFPLLHIYVELIFGYEPIMCTLHFIVLANFNNKVDMSI